MSSGNKRARLAASISSSLIRFRPDHALTARFSRKNAAAGFAVAKRNNADRHLQITFDFLFHFARTVPVSECEAPMDLGLAGVFGGEEIVELLFRLDHVRVCLLKLFRAIVKILLDRHQNFRGARSELLD